MQDNTSFTTLEHPCMVARLWEEMRCALVEFRDCPGDYIKGAFARPDRGGRRTTLLRLGFVLALLAYTAAFALILVLSIFSRSGERATGNNEIFVGWTPLFAHAIDLQRDNEEAGGGGGGGRKTQTPPSAGSIPAPSLSPMVSPRPEAQIRPPVLPVIETVMLDPRIPVPRDDSIPTGIPDGVAAPPSAGPGSNGGIGTSFGEGIGPGEGPGVGAGSGGNIGDGAFHIGGRRRPVPPQNASVDTIPILLNEPRPFYTEDARKNKVQGVVKVHILVNSTGEVSEVVVTRGLPYGLTEQAIRAAYQMRFTPATRGGRAVPYWITNVEIEFNLR